MSQLFASARAGSSLTSSALSANEDKPPMCLSPQDKSKGATKVSLTQRMKTSQQSAISMAVSVSAAAAALAMDFDMSDAAMDLDVDLELDLVDDDDQDHDMDDAGWVSDDNLRALEFDERLNQDIDWVTHDDVTASLKLDFIPSGVDVQDFGFDPSSFLSPLRGGLSFEDSDMSSSFAESLSVDTPPPSFGSSSHDAEKLLMSFDTMNFTIPSPTSSSSKTTRASLFGKKEADAKDAAKVGSGVVSGTAAARQSLTAKGTMSPSLKMKAGAAADETRKDDARASLSKLSIPSPDSLLGVLSITTPTMSSHVVDSQKKIGSYSPEARRLRIQKFHEKRKNRTWKKSIKYDCRKKLADDRPRIKGRFVRVLENTCDIKEEDTCSTTSTASTSSSPSSAGPSSPQSLLSTMPTMAAPVNPTVLLAAAAPVTLAPTPTVVLLAQPVIPSVAAPVAPTLVVPAAAVTPAPVRAPAPAPSLVQIAATPVPQPGVAVPLAAKSS